ncbi:miaB, partial [Symbiodinium sp. KB8]
EDPDVIVLNTCSIRDKAEKRVYARLDPHLQRKRRGEDVTIVVSGCVAQQEGEALLSAIPEVDVVVGPQYANRLADVLNESLQGGQICATADARIMEDVTMPNRQSSISAWVNVIYGCNERCSYCVVPATRGSEQSRPMEAVKREVAQLTSEGYREVTLLGQNIDAWGRDLAPRRNFAELLRYVGDVAGLERLRFLTSHPRYISDELIHTVRDVDAVCEQFHIPFQSGDDDVLRRMERGYTAERYRQIVRKIRQEVPKAGLSADAIVGFPGETEEQFQRTVELVEEIGFLTVNLAAYSPRPNTLAATWPDQVPEDVKKDRLQRLGDVVLRTSLAQSQRLLGEVHELLVEAPHPRRSGEVRGRL